MLKGQDFVPFIETCDSLHAETNVAYAMFPNFITPTDTSGYVAILFGQKVFVRQKLNIYN